MWVSGDKFLVYLICILSHNLNMLKDNRKKKHEVLGLEQNLIIIKFIIQMLVFTFPGGASGKEPGLSVQAVLEKQEMQETKVQSLDGDDPLEKEMVIHFSILSWRIPWTEEPGGLQSIGSHRVRHN